METLLYLFVFIGLGGNFTQQQRIAGDYPIQPGFKNCDRVRSLNKFDL